VQRVKAGDATCARGRDTSEANSNDLMTSATTA